LPIGNIFADSHVCFQSSQRKRYLFENDGKILRKNGVTLEVPDLPYADLLRILVSADCSYALTKYDAIFFFLYHRHHHAADCPTNHYDTGDLLLPVAME
jgi:hypothetical protein